MTIDDRLKDNFLKLLEHDYETIGVFLYGSQNYSLATEHSDIDCKAMVVTPRDELILRKPLISKVIEVEGGQIEVKAIQLMTEMFKKQNINFLEILFTEYYAINNNYDHLITFLRNNREKIARADERKTLFNIVGMQKQKASRLFKEVGSTQKDIDKYGYSAKDLHHIVRLNEFAIRYIAGTPYIECLKSEMPDYLISIKQGRFDKDKVMMVANASIEQTEEMVKDYLSSKQIKVDEDVFELLDKVAIMAYL